jgi:hypothetical protein
VITAKPAVLEIVASKLDYARFVVDDQDGFHGGLIVSRGIAVEGEERGGCRGLALSEWFRAVGLGLQPSCQQDRHGIAITGWSERRCQTFGWCPPGSVVP